MPRPHNPDAPNGTARKAKTRAARGSKAIELPGDTWAALQAIAERDGDGSATAAAVRVIEAALRISV